MVIARYHFMTKLYNSRARYVKFIKCLFLIRLLFFRDQEIDIHLSISSGSRKKGNLHIMSLFEPLLKIHTKLCKYVNETSGIVSSI